MLTKDAMQRRQAESARHAPLEKRKADACGEGVRTKEHAAYVA